jgi:hypothetical protein
MGAIKAAVIWASGFLTDRGIPSSTRLIMLVGTLVPLSVWAGLSVYRREVLDVPSGVIAMIVACLGLKGVDRYIASRAEVAQIEKDKPPAPEPTPPPPPQNIGVQIQTEATGEAG